MCILYAYLLCTAYVLCTVCVCSTGWSHKWGNVSSVNAVCCMPALPLTLMWHLIATHAVTLHIWAHQALRRTWTTQTPVSCGWGCVHLYTQWPPCSNVCFTQSGVWIQGDSGPIQSWLLCCYLYPNTHWNKLSSYNIEGDEHLTLNHVEWTQCRLLALHWHPLHTCVYV